MGYKELEKYESDYNNRDWVDEISMCGLSEGEGFRMPYEDEESMEVLLKAYNEAGYIDENDDYGTNSRMPNDEIVLNVVSELSKMQKDIIDGKLKVVSAEEDTEVVIMPGYMGVIDECLTKTQIVSRMVAVKYLSSVVFKCMEIVNTDNYTNIEEVREDLVNFQNDLEDKDSNDIVIEIVKDLATIS